MKKNWWLLALLFSLFVVRDVHANTYTDTINEHGMWIPGEFVNKTKNGSTKYQQMTMIVRNSDGKYLYCIEPGKSIYEDNIFTGYDDDQASHVNISNDIWEKINLISYYGYGYTGHEDIKWYVITQYMIWQANNLGYDIYFTDTLNGNRITKYENEIREIENLINDHYKKPKFSNNLVGILLGDNNVFIDSNDVLNEYDITTDQNIEISVNGNELYLKNDDENIESGRVDFKKKSDRFSNLPTVYLDGRSQKLLLPGNVGNINYTLTFYTIYGSLNVKKEDMEGINYNQASLKDAIYALYDSNYNLIETKSTDENGEIHFDTKLAKGQYFFKEIEPSIGYNLDENEYYFDNNKNDYRHDWTVREKVIKENFEITKYIKNDDVIMPESNIEFGIYDYNDNLIETYNTSSNGTIKFSLSYGSYILKQHTAYPGYEKIKDYNIEVKKNEKFNKLIFVDKLIEEEIEQIEPEISKEENSQPEEEITQEVEKQIELEDEEKIIFDQEDLVVKVPNTLKNSNINLIYILLLGIYLKKKTL